MSNFKIAFLLSVFLFASLLGVGVCFRSFYGLRRKAYSPAILLVVMVISLAIPFGLVLLVADSLSVGLFLASPEPVSAVVGIASIFLFVPVCFAAVSYLLPKWPHQSGAQKRNYLEWPVTRVVEMSSPWLGTILLLAGTSGFWWLPKYIPALRLIQFGCSFMLLRPTIRHMRELDATPSAEEVTQLDQRPCVLYIRASRRCRFHLWTQARYPMLYPRTRSGREENLGNGYL
jgi:hypothetical protein